MEVFLPGYCALLARSISCGGGRLPGFEFVFWEDIAGDHHGEEQLGFYLPLRFLKVSRIGALEYLADGFHRKWCGCVSRE